MEQLLQRPCRGSLDDQVCYKIKTFVAQVTDPSPLVLITTSRAGGGSQMPIHSQATPLNPRLTR